MKISKITSQRSGKRSNIFINDEYAFSLDDLLVIKYGLKKDVIISDELMEKLFNEDNYTKAKTKAFFYLSFKNRTEKEIFTYLEKNDFPYSVIEEVITYLKDENYIDDQSYACDYAHYKSISKNHGYNRIKYELQKKGIDKETIDRALDYIDVDVESLVEQVQKKYKNYKIMSYVERKRKVSGYLIRRGHDYGTISLVLDKLMSEQ